jgi:hypothetical protein
MNKYIKSLLVAAAACAAVALTPHAEEAFLIEEEELIELVPIEEKPIEEKPFPLDPIIIEPQAEIIGLFSPWAPDKVFKLRRAIPLKFQVLLDNELIDSSELDLGLNIYMVSDVVSPIPAEDVQAAGASGWQYDYDTDTNQFNWKTTKAWSAGTYRIVVTIDSFEIGKGFLLQLK